MTCIILLFKIEMKKMSKNNKMELTSQIIFMWRKMRSQINPFNLLISQNNKRQMENSRKCDVCNIDVHRAFISKHLKSKKH